VLCRLLRGDAEGNDVGPDMQQHLQGRIDLYLSDRQAELGVKLDSMLIVQAGEPDATQLPRWHMGCCAAVQMHHHLVRRWMTPCLSSAVIALLRERFLSRSGVASSAGLGSITAGGPDQTTSTSSHVGVAVAESTGRGEHHADGVGIPACEWFE
jgi:hypothetical protein